jgi:hypothetical protein
MVVRGAAGEGDEVPRHMDKERPQPEDLPQAEERGGAVTEAGGVDSKRLQTLRPHKVPHFHLAFQEQNFIRHQPHSHHGSQNYHMAERQPL